jgi:hypothetical protein
LRDYLLKKSDVTVIISTNESLGFNKKLVFDHGKV